MFRLGPYTFRPAESARDLEAVHRLNYRTFVREVPQHPDHGGESLVDKFHHKNRYLIALAGDRVVGMVAVSDEPPFSVAGRLPDPGVLTAAGVRPAEVRLLAVEPACRHSPVLTGLAWAVYEYARNAGRTHLFISAVTGRLDLYRRMGFEPLGPAVACGGAAFVPMRVSLDRAAGVMGRTLRRLAARTGRGAVDPVCLLPGPVAIAARVRAAFAEPPAYHRGDSFIELFEGVRRRLARLTNSAGVALLAGGGTLANEAVAATLAAGPGAADGLVLVNGEFGDRLRRQTARWGLRPRVLEWPWGRPWDLDAVAAALHRLRPGGWVWGVHHETSTGVLNDLPGLVRAAAAYSMRVCADAVSSVGAVPVDLSGVYLATATAGKALGAYAGLAMVFADPRRLVGIDAERLPEALDVPAALAATGPRFTISTPCVRALDAALDEYATPARFAALAAAGTAVRRRLRAMGARVLADEADACPVLTTFAVPAGDTSDGFVRRCGRWGFRVAGQSEYLARRRLAQVATMGEVREEECGHLMDRLARLPWDAAPGTSAPHALLDRAGEPG